MPSSPIVYPDWKAPREDGQILIWPDPPELLKQTVENHQRLSKANDAGVQNVPLAELRCAARSWIGHNDDQVLIGDGHQSELHHAGVWVKRILTNAAASRLSGSAAHFAVDTDA